MVKAADSGAGGAGAQALVPPIDATVRMGAAIARPRNSLASLPGMPFVRFASRTGLLFATDRSLVHALPWSSGVFRGAAAQETPWAEAGAHTPKLSSDREPTRVATDAPIHDTPRAQNRPAAAAAEETIGALQWTSRLGARRSAPPLAGPQVAVTRSPVAPMPAPLVHATHTSAGAPDSAATPAATPGLAPAHAPSDTPNRGAPPLAAARDPGGPHPVEPRLVAPVHATAPLVDRSAAPASAASSQRWTALGETNADVSPAPPEPPRPLTTLVAGWSLGLARRPPPVLAHDVLTRALPVLLAGVSPSVPADRGPTRASGSPRDSSPRVPPFSPLADLPSPIGAAAAVHAGLAPQIPTDSADPEQIQSRRRPTLDPTDRPDAAPLPLPARDVATTSPRSLNHIADSLHELVKREVSEAVERLDRRTSSTQPAPQPSTSPAPAVDVTSDEFVRRLMGRLRTLTEEERFRSGRLR
jgi:hypothetical protein